MFCTKCGAKNPEDAKFCYKCGNEIYKTIEKLSDNSPESPSVDFGYSNFPRWFYVCHDTQSQCSL